ncbi:MAG: hypothetical protein IT486_01180 [Gammaproteobacteria bacterium]|nr:hypothetical protein [Gammaproteobacteria bacterium]
MTAALSLEQAPPLSVPLRFFLTAPAFGMAAAALLAWAGPAALGTRWTPAVLALTHLVGLGVLTMVMAGALFQMLPVLVGVRIARPLLVGRSCHGLLSAGVMALAAGFLGAGRPAFHLASLLLGGGLGLLLAVVGTGLARAPRMHDSVHGMRWALSGLAVAVTLGLVLTLGRGGASLPLARAALTDTHLAWALLGWVALLVAVVAWQVVPMFQVTAEYPAWLRRGLAATTWALLLWLSAATLLDWPAGPPAAGLALAFAIFAAQTLGLLARRRRRRADASLAFWLLGMVALAAAALAALAGLLLPLPPALALLPAVLFLAGFALSVVQGMLLKIVPFLVWLHLQQELGRSPAALARVTPPHMHAVMPEPRARLQFLAHAAALGTLLAALAVPALVRPAALLWLVAFASLGANLLGAARLYRATRHRIGAAA